MKSLRDVMSDYFFENGFNFKLNVRLYQQIRIHELSEPVLEHQKLLDRYRQLGFRNIFKNIEIF